MKKYLDLVINKAKKAISIEKIYEKIENVLKEEYGEDYILDDDSKKEIDLCLNEAVENNEIIVTSNNNYISIKKSSFRKGIFYGDKKGNGEVTVVSSYISKDDGKKVITESKYSISKDQSFGAIDGDTVLIDIGNNIVCPKVVKILERNLENIAGEIYRVGANYYVKPVDKKKQNLLISLDGQHIEGQRVLVKLNKQTSSSSYIGEIVSTLEHKDDPDNDILWEAMKCGIDAKFSDASLEQVKTIPQSVSDTDKIGRCDLTDWEIFTIDGADTKDIDDALSCRILPNNHVEVGVHIADVPYYVKKDTALDKDAFKRGNSYYLGGKVIPMLPHELSNGICSLNPQVERLAKSCIIELDENGDVVNYSIQPTVIRSRMKMTYDNVNKILKGEEYPPEYEEHVNTLKLLNKIALKLRSKRVNSGAVEFNRPEIYFKMDDQHQIVDFIPRKCDLAENLIEEFMLLANKTVDKHIVDNEYPCIHRIHDTPNYERLAEYFNLLNVVNMPFHKYSIDECACDSKALQELAEHIKQDEKLSNVLALRLVKCMSRAKYSIENIGHFGLSTPYYTHFTSPIRRYSDLTIHRILNDIYDESSHTLQYDDASLSEIAAQTTRTEKVADDAEEEVLRMKCSEYMAKHIGEEFEATITGVSDKTICVELDNLIEGRVKTKSLHGGYIYNPETFTLVSVEGRENYYFGDRVKVKLVAASKEDKTIDFEILEKIHENYIDDVEDSNSALIYKTKMKKINEAFF